MVFDPPRLWEVTSPERPESDPSCPEAFRANQLTEITETPFVFDGDAEAEPVYGKEVPLRGAFRGQELLKALAEDRALERHGESAL